MECVKVCPVDCFHEAPLMLVIDPDECIDCTLCEPECPTEAIVSEEELPEDQKAFLKINAQLSKLFPVVTEQHETFPDARNWRDVRGKAALLGFDGGEFNPQESKTTLDKYESLLSSPIGSEREWTARLSDPNPLVRLAVTTREDFVLTQARLEAGLKDRDEHVRRRYVALRMDKLTPAQVDALLGDPSPAVRRETVDRTVSRLTPVQIDRILGDADESCRLTLYRKEAFRPTLEQFNRITGTDSAVAKLIVLQRIHDQIQPLLFDHPDDRVRKAAFAKRNIKLTRQQANAGLADPSADVVYEVVSRSDVKVTPAQFVELVRRKDRRITATVCSRADTRSIDALLGEPNDALIASTVEFLPSLSAGQVDGLIAGRRWKALRALFRFKPDAFSRRQLAECRTASDWGVRLAAIHKTGIGKIPPDEIAILLHDRTEKIREAVAGSPSVRLSRMQIEAALTDSAVVVRLATASREDFRPTPAQYRRGLRDPDARVKVLFKRRFALRGGKIVATKSRVKAGGTALSERLRRTLDEIAAIPTWTKRKHELKAVLDDLIRQSRYVIYSVDARDAPVRSYGEHTTMTVPVTRRGALKPLRGKTVHVICVGQGHAAQKKLAMKAV
jgi:ferredoxin